MLRFFKVTVKHRLWIISVSSSKSLVTCLISIRVIQFVSSVAWYLATTTTTTKNEQYMGYLYIWANLKFSQNTGEIWQFPQGSFSGFAHARTKINIAFNSHYIHIYDSKLLILHTLTLKLTGCVFSEEFLSRRILLELKQNFCPSWTSRPKRPSISS